MHLLREKYLKPSKKVKVKNEEFHLKITLNILLILCVFILISCGKVPDTHYYQLSYPALDNSITQAKIDKIVGVKKFVAEPPYDQDRIVYRESPFEVKFYNYRRWVCSPREMLSESAVRHLRGSGLFAGVVHAQNNQSFDYLLCGHIHQFEEWDEADAWQARVKLWIELRSVSTDNIIWQGYVESQVPVIEKTPLNVVKALSSAVDSCLQELVKQLSQNL